MGLIDLSIKKHYSSDNDDILNDFYIPVLQESIEYKRLAGFFSSSSLAVAARGIVGLIDNGGIMKLIMSPKLSEQDVKIMTESYETPEKFIEDKMLFELDYLNDSFTMGHIQALGWLLANKKLDIKIAMPYENDVFLNYEEAFTKGIFHLKIGILSDIYGNIVSFSGSVNESAMGWINNIEEFKVFRNWELSEREYLEADRYKFEIYWEDLSPKVKTLIFPKALAKKIIDISPSDKNELNIRKLYPKYPIKKREVRLYNYQNEAISSWLERGKKGIFEMATGTGKTYTALGCIKEILKSYKGVLIVITCPYSHLIDQWKKNIELFDFANTPTLIADGRSSKWKKILREHILDSSVSYKNTGNLIILTTHDTFSSADFTNIITSASNKELMLVADEMHWLGAPTLRKGLLTFYKFRLGLSATPKRWFDDLGTISLYEYFDEYDDKDLTYIFPLDKAMYEINPATGKTFLTSYFYYPIFVNLSNSELEKYNKLTLSYIWKLQKTKNKVESDDILQNLLFQRADIIKNAESKIPALSNLLESLNKDRIHHLIVYGTPDQLNQIYEIINNKGIICHTFTMDEGTKPSEIYGGVSERQYILNKFDEGKYQALVAIKCLDEGVDVPSASMAILMGSSGNPKEYIQRIGRIIRRHEEKDHAIIYDIIVVPRGRTLDPKVAKLEKQIFEKEMRRYWEIAKLAINNADALNILIKLKDEIK